MFFVFFRSSGTTLYEHIPPTCRGLFLEYHYFFKCKCAICSNPNWTPFSRQDLDQHPLYEKGIEPTWMDLQEIRQLTPEQISTYERDAAKFLEVHDRLHPVQATMMMQHNLHMLWNTFASRRWCNIINFAQIDVNIIQSHLKKNINTFQKPINSISILFSVNWNRNQLFLKRNLAFVCVISNILWFLMILSLLFSVRNKTWCLFLVSF